MASLNEKLKRLIFPSSNEKALAPTVELAVDKIMSDLSEFDSAKIVHMDEQRLIFFHLSYGIFIRNEFRLWSNVPLKKSCCEISGLSVVNPDLASLIILKELQKKLRQADDLQDIK